MKLNPADLVGSTLEVCRNGQCYQATISTVRDPPAEGTGSGLADFPDVAQRDVLHTPRIWTFLLKEADGYQVEINYIPWVSNEGTDGDTYDVVLTLADQTRLLDAHLTATYKVTQTCAGDCKSFPGTL